MEAPKQDYSQSLTKIDEDEKVLAIVKRHPFGIIKLYFQIVFGLIFSIGLTAYLLPTLIDRDTNPEAYSIAGVLAIIVVLFMLVIAAIATIIYYKSQLILTDKSITQTIQTSLFSRKVSQLAVSSIEDVTANKNGVFPTIFNFGRLLVETAGEQENFHFDYCPHPDHYAKLILETRQQFMGSREAEYRDQSTAYARNNNPAPSNLSAPQNAPRKSFNPINMIGDIAVDGTDDDALNKSNKQ